MITSVFCPKATYLQRDPGGAQPSALGLQLQTCGASQRRTTVCPQADHQQAAPCT